MKNILLSIIAMIVLVFAALFASNILDRNIKNSVEQIEANAGENPSSQENSKFSSHLPIVHIETNGQTISKEETVWSTISVIDNKNGKNHLEDKYKFETAATLKYRGSSSMDFDKKQYRLEFYKERESTKKEDISVMGMAKESDWVLYGPYLDRTLIRDILLYSISREILDWAPNTKYCEVFLDGAYKGVYLMMESVKVRDSRIHLKDFGLINGETSYMLQREMAGSESNPINSFGTYSGKTYHQLSIKYPSEQKLMEKQKDWIQKDVSEFERVLYSSKFDDGKEGYSKYIDVDSFVDYYILNEFAMIKDAGFLSTIVYKDLGGKLKTTVWDFNNAFDNYPNMPMDSKGFYVSENNWYGRLIKDRSFAEKVVRRYHELRKGILSEERLFKYIDDTALYLGDAVDRNFEVWGHTFNNKLMINGKQGVSRDPKNYDEAIIMLKEEIRERGKFLDENIDTLYQYSIN